MLIRHSADSVDVTPYFVCNETPKTWGVMVISVARQVLAPNCIQIGGLTPQTVSHQPGGVQGRPRYQ